MQSRHQFLHNDPTARRWIALFRAGAGSAIALALTAAAITAVKVQPGATVAVEISPLAGGPADAAYDGPESGPAAAPVLRDEFSSFDQLYPHAYAGQPGVQG